MSDYSERLAARRAARALALQILYELDVTNHEMGPTIAAHLADAQLDDTGNHFVSEVVRGVSEHQVALDLEIQKTATEWPVEQIPAVERSLLRMGLYELLYMTQTPATIVINEATTLANTYGTVSSQRFINGVLATLAEQHSIIQPSRKRRKKSRKKSRS